MAMPPASSKRLNPISDVYAVAVDVIALDNDVTQVDAYAEINAALRRAAAFRSALLCWISTAQRSASTTLWNSTRIPSPIVLIKRP